jgi:hypothetical protein
MQRFAGLTVFFAIWRFESRPRKMNGQTHLSYSQERMPKQPYNAIILFGLD